MARAVAGADALIHLAAIPTPLLGTPREVFATNTQATFVALEAAGVAGVGRRGHRVEHLAARPAVRPGRARRRCTRPSTRPPEHRHRPVRAVQGGRRGDRGDDASTPRLPGRGPADLGHGAHGAAPGPPGRGRAGPDPPVERAVGLSRRAGRGARLRACRRARHPRLPRHQRHGPRHLLGAADRGADGPLPSQRRRFAGRWWGASRCSIRRAVASCSGSRRSIAWRSGTRPTPVSSPATAGTPGWRDSSHRGRCRRTRRARSSPSRHSRSR